MRNVWVSLFLLAVLLAAGIGVRNLPFTDGELEKDMPPVKTTVDQFFHMALAKGTHDQFDVAHFPPFATMNERVLSSQPPMSYVIPATFAYFSPFPFYQTFFLLACIFLVVMCLQVFVILRMLFSSRVALYAFILSLFPAVGYASVLYIGRFMDVFAFLFVPALVFFFLRSLQRQSLLEAVLIGCLAAAGWLAHVVEVTYFLAFLGLWEIVGIRRWRERWPWWAAFGLTFFLLIFAFLPLFLQGYGTRGVPIDWGSPSWPASYQDDISLSWPVYLLSVLGAVVLLLSRLSRVQKAFAAFLLVYFFILSSWLVGMNWTRTFRIYFLFYPFFAFLPAFGLYWAERFACSFIPKGLVRVLVFVALALIVVPFAQDWGEHVGMLQDGSFMTGAKWEGVRWIRDNTPVDATVYALNGLQHSYMMFSQRFHVKGDTGFVGVENMRTICDGRFNGTVKGAFMNWAFLAEHDHHILDRGLFSIESELVPPPVPTKGNFSKNFESPNFWFNISDFDYVYINYNNNQFAQCLAPFAQELANSKDYEPVFYNDEVIVLRPL